MHTKDELSQDPTWVPAAIPTDKPSPARIYDYLLGGYHNFEVDRIMVEKLLTIYPDTKQLALLNRAFLNRAVEFLLEADIDQFLDIGSGIPTLGNVHEIAQNKNPSARVVYVDIDPIATAHSKAILQDNPNATSIQADIRQPDTILNHPEVKEMIDFNQPVGLTLVAILHFIVDDEKANNAIRLLTKALTQGSIMVISHSALELETQGAINARQEYTAGNTKRRSRDQLLQFFEGFKLVEPGLVPIPSWHPESSDDIFYDQPERSTGYACVGVKR